MNIQEILKILKEKEILKQETVEIEELSGGTTSKLYLLHFQDSSKIVLKFNRPRVIESESFFLNFYTSLNVLPNVIYVDEQFHFMLYTYVEGQNNYLGNNKTELLSDIVHSLINHYKNVPEWKGWGWVSEQVSSKRDFLLDEVCYASKMVNQVLGEDNERLIREIINGFKELEEEAFLIHGDCGVHNFLFKDHRLNGVIDPTPIFGYPLYDLVYAFCSSPNDLSKETIYYAASQLKLEKPDIQRLNEEVLIGLFLRMSSCIKYHPHDLPQYLDGWEYWKEIVLIERNKKQ